MKNFILLATMMFLTIGVFAQSPLEVDRVQLNVGVGVTGWGVPVYFGLDYGIAKDFTLGGQISFQTDNDPYYYDNKNYNYNSKAIGIGGNVNYHFNRVLHIPSKFDFYAGLSLTYFIWNYDDYNDNPHPDNTSLGLGLQVGGRYFFTKKFGVNLEFGGGTATSGAKIGVTFKI